MQNPFENPEGVYYVLVNDENQHSLWPAFAEIPARLGSPFRPGQLPGVPRLRERDVDGHATQEPH